MAPVICKNTSHCHHDEICVEELCEPAQSGPLVEGSYCLPGQCPKDAGECTVVPNARLPKGGVGPRDDSTETSICVRWCTGNPSLPSADHLCLTGCRMAIAPAPCPGGRNDYWDYWGGSGHCPALESNRLCDAKSG
jgi:hypothetical protein